MQFWYICRKEFFKTESETDKKIYSHSNMSQKKLSDLTILSIKNNFLRNIDF